MEPGRQGGGGAVTDGTVCRAPNITAPGFRGPVITVERCCAWFRDWPLGLSIARPRSDRWPCTSPRRHQCRAGLSRGGYGTRERWRYQQHDAGRRGYAHTSWDQCRNPLAGVRASDWLREAID